VAVDLANAGVAPRAGGVLTATNVTKITAFRFAYRAECCDMWLFRNNPLKKITDPFAALSVWGSYVRLRI
jgi:hypothetical protein